MCFRFAAVFGSMMKFAASLCLSLVLLSGICLVYNYTGCHVANPDGATDYKWEANQYFSTMKEGFSWFRFDKNGYNNTDDSDFLEKPVDILLTGSSHIEAVQIAKNQNIGHLLNEWIPGARTYSIGISGHAIYSCVANLRRAAEIYTPRKFLLIETGSVRLDENSMRKVIDGDFPRIKSYDTGLIYLVQKTVPAVKSLYKSAVEWKTASALKKTVRKDPEDAEPDDEYKKNLEKFLSFAKRSVPENCGLLIFYHPAASLDSGGKYIDNNDSGYLKIFSEACDLCGIWFVDMSEDFSRLYKTRRKFAHGFPNTAVSAGHLNADGHRIIAARLSEVITENWK